MSVTTAQLPEAAAPRWLLPVLSFASSLYLHVLLALVLVAVVATAAAGLTPHVISTGSMQPAVKPGDLVLTAVPDDAAELGLGTVITYRHPMRADERVTHRIVEVLPSGGYRTRGDANAATDAYVVEPEHVVGVGRLVVPLIGLPATWLRHGMWVEFAFFALASLFALAGATLQLDDEDGDPRDEEGRPAPATSWRGRLAPGWTDGRMAAIGASGVALVTGAVLLLGRRAGEAATAGAGSGTEAPGSWHALAAGLVVASALALAFGATARAGDLPGRDSRWRGRAAPIAARLEWLERNGALFVAVLALLVMAGAGTALASTAAGAFNDATGSTATMAADQVAPPTDLAAVAGCDGFSPTVDLSWTAPGTGSVDGYEIRRGPTGSESLLGTVLGALTTTYEDTSVADATTYSYEVSTTVGSWTSDPAGNPTVGVTTADCSPPDMWVGSLDGSATDEGLTWTASATVTVVDENGPVSGAAVSGDWTGLGLPAAGCTTDGNGQCTVAAAGLVVSEATFTVTDVAEASHTYVEPSGSPSVTIPAP